MSGRKGAYIVVWHWLSCSSFVVGYYFSFLDKAWYQYVATYWFYMLHCIDGNKKTLMKKEHNWAIPHKKLRSFANKLQYKAVYVLKYIKVECTCNVHQHIPLQYV